METLKILVVDDEPGMRAGVARALEGHRVLLPEIDTEIAFSVETAETAEEALRLLPAASPDIILLDHKLPGMSGLEALEKISESDARPMVIMVTAYASFETAVSAVKRGAYDFLAKPFTPDELKNTLRKASESLMLARHARRLAYEKRQVRFQFISVLAHELKAPLAAIEGYLHIIKSRSAGSDPAVYDRMLERSLIRAEYMRKMILDLLDLTRIESGQKRREVSQVDVAEAAGAAMETAAASAAERNITIALDAPASAVMTADLGEIDIILNNLVSNAVKYNRDAGSVELSIHADERDVTIEVADTGIGMTPEEAERLFNDFVRIKNDKTRNILGSGLGLSIVKKLARLYGGDVSVKSEPDKGSAFTVVLKRSEENQQHGAPDQNKGGGGRGAPAPSQ